MTGEIYGAGGGDGNAVKKNKRGPLQGRSVQIRRVEEAYQAGKNLGYNLGYCIGFESGYDKGYAEGSHLGYNNGFLDALLHFYIYL